MSTSILVLAMTAGATATDVRAAAEPDGLFDLGIDARLTASAAGIVSNTSLSAPGGASAAVGIGPVLWAGEGHRETAFLSPSATFGLHGDPNGVFAVVGADLFFGYGSENAASPGAGRLGYSGGIVGGAFARFPIGGRGPAIPGWRIGIVGRLPFGGIWAKNPEQKGDSGEAR